MQRDQIKQEKEMVMNHLDSERERLEKEKQKAKTDAIAEKTKNRTMPYGLNYSKAKDFVVEDVDVPFNHAKGVDHDTFQKLANDRSKRNKYLANKSTDKKPVRKPIGMERLKMLSNEKLGSRISYNQVILSKLTYEL